MIADELRTVEVETDPGEREELELELAFLAGQLSLYEGVPQDWPADVDEALTPDAFEARWQEVLAARGATLDAVQCAEYPCFVAFTAPVHTEAYQACRDAFVAFTGSDDATWSKLHVQHLPDEDGQARVRCVVAPGPRSDEREPAAVKRLDWRFDQHDEQLRGLR